MNPPFKGAVDKGGVHPTLPSDTTKSELLFLHLILRALDMGGRAAVIVPDGVLFGSSRAHVEVRRRIIEENRLDGVVSTPALACWCKCAFGCVQAVRGGEYGGAVLHARRADEGHLVL